MRLSLATLMGMLDFDKPAQRAISKWVDLSSKRPYDKEIAATWSSKNNRIKVAYL